MKFDSYVCAVCKHIKPSALGRFVRSKTRYNHKYFVCDNCGSTPPIHRHHRQNQESLPERQVRETLQHCGFRVDAEFKLTPFIYDFAVPALRLLIEVDSRSYHRFPRQQKRDRVKTLHAQRKHWKLVRLKVNESVGLEAHLAVKERAEELGLRP
jgi:very-short-patch-repair endonuclease